MPSDIAERIRAIFASAKADIVSAAITLALELCEYHGSNEWESEVVIHHAAWLISKELSLEPPSYSDFIMQLRSHNQEQGTK